MSSDSSASDSSDGSTVFIDGPTDGNKIVSVDNSLGGITGSLSKRLSNGVSPCTGTTADGAMVGGRTVIVAADGTTDSCADITGDVDGRDVG